MACSLGAGKIVAGYRGFDRPCTPLFDPNSKYLFRYPVQHLHLAGAGGIGTVYGKYINSWIPKVH